MKYSEPVINWEYRVRYSKSIGVRLNFGKGQLEF